MEEFKLYPDILQDGEIMPTTQDNAENGFEGEQAMILRQLERRIGGFSPHLQAQIRALSLYQLEALGEALLDFSEPDDLKNWLQSNDG